MVTIEHLLLQRLELRQQLDDINPVLITQLAPQVLTIIQTCELYDEFHKLEGVSTSDILERLHEQEKRYEIGDVSKALEVLLSNNQVKRSYYFRKYTS